jgi:hypothetical protein
LDLPRAVLEAERKAEEAFQRLTNPQQQPTETPAPAAEQPQPEAPAPAPAPAPEDEKWEARYKVLHGKYNAEVPRLHASMKERDSELSSLREEVEALKRQKEATPLIKPEEVEEFGEPLVDLIRRAAREEVSVKEKEIEELKSQLKSIRTDKEQSNESSFYEKLAASVPDWMAINDDPDFHTWLGEYDELTGYQRQQILSEAENKRDANRVARFFDAFKKIQSKSQVASASSLESQVAPTSTKTEAAPPSKKIWTRGEIADFYARDRRGEYTADQAGAIDKDIQLAVREGRVR